MAATEPAPRPTFDFEGFLSYSTVPDYALTRKTESFLEGFHSTFVGRSLKLSPLNICVDGSDFSLAKMQTASTADAVIETLLYEHLARCRRLLVFCSRNSAASTYVDMEIEWWLKHRDRDSILLIATEGANPASNPDEIFSKRIRDASLHLRPWYDFRGFRSREALDWSLVRDAQAERVQLTAHLYGETAGRLYPTWKRARDRTRRVLASLAVAAGVGLVAGGSWFAWTLTDIYQIQKIVDHAPLSSGTNEEWVVALARADRLDEARAIALQQDEYTAGRLNALGAQLLTEGKRDAARAVYELALQVPAEGRTVLPDADSDILTNSILLGVREELIAPLRERFKHPRDFALVSAPVKLAKHGLYEQAVELARSMNSNFQHMRADMLIGVAKMTTDRAKAIAALDEARRSLIPPEGLSSADNPDLQLQGLAIAYAELGRATDALDVAERIGSQKAEFHLGLAGLFLAEHKWPLVQRAVEQAGPIFESSKVANLQSVLQMEKGSVEDALRFAQYLEPNASRRGRLLLTSVESYADPIVAGTHPGLPSLAPLISAGAALLAGGKPIDDARIEISIAKGWILAADLPQARTHLANAARLAIAAKDWYWLDSIVHLSAAAKASDDDLAWIERIPQGALRDKTRARVPIERKYGADGRPLREWLASNQGSVGAWSGPYGALVGPYERWFEKCVATGDVKTAIEASKGIYDDARRGAVMLVGVRALLTRNQVAEAHELTNAITFEQDRSRAIGLMAPVLVKQGAIDQAVAETGKIADPLLRARTLGALSVALMPSAPARARDLLDESLGLLRANPTADARDTELATIANAFCEQTDVAASRLALENMTRDETRVGVEVCIVRALLKLQSLRDARIAADSIASTRHREEAYTAILNAYADAKRGVRN